MKQHPTEHAAPSAVVKRSLRISGHPTSVTLEDAFWMALKEIAAGRGLSLNALVAEIDEAREGNLSSAIRVYVLDWYRNRQAEKQAGTSVHDIGGV